MLINVLQLVIRETKDFIDEVAREANNGEVDFDFEGAVKRLSLNIVLSLNYGTRYTPLFNILVSGV